MYTRFISKATQVICTNSKIDDKDTRLVIEYGLNSAISIGVTFISLLVVSCIMGILTEVMLISVFSLLLRMGSGGSHSKTFIGCYLITLVVFIGLGFLLSNIDETSIGVGIDILVIIGFLLSFSLVVFKAPVDCEEKRISNKRKIHFKRLSIILCICVFVLQLGLIHKLYPTNVILSISLGVVWQSLQLTYISKILFSKLDGILMKGGN